MIRTGITGQSGFIGTHLAQWLGRDETVCIVPFSDRFFDDPDALYRFVQMCDVVVHLAGVNRHPDLQALHDTNLSLTLRLIAAFEKTESRPGVIFSSSIQEYRNGLYGESKRACRELLTDWASRNHTSFSGLILPNVFGPGAKPDYNSFIATFCRQLICGECPVITEDREIPLLHIDTLCRFLSEEISGLASAHGDSIKSIDVAPDFRMRVSEVLRILEGFHSSPRRKAQSLPEQLLFQTYQSYL